jgi:hypothetical protein
MSMCVQASVLGALVSLHMMSLVVEWRTKFFLIWLCLSIAALYQQFYVELMPSCSLAYSALLHMLFLLMLTALFLSVYSRPDPSVRDSGSGDEESLPLRGSHCRMCNTWIFGRDHHCVWLDDCVGGHNHRYFLSFLCTFVTMAAQFSWLVMGSEHAPDSIGGEPISPLLQGAALYAGLAAVAVGLLVCSQVQHISVNRLTSETISISKRARQLQKRYNESTKSPQLRRQLDSERARGEGGESTVDASGDTTADNSAADISADACGDAHLLAVHPESQRLRGRAEEEEEAAVAVADVGGTNAGLRQLMANWVGFLDGSRLHGSPSLTPLHPRAIRF